MVWIVMQLFLFKNIFLWYIHVDRYIDKSGSLLPAIVFVWKYHTLSTTLMIWQADCFQYFIFTNTTQGLSSDLSLCICTNISLG